MLCEVCGAPATTNQAACPYCHALYSHPIGAAGASPAPISPEHLVGTHCKRREGHVSRTTTVTLTSDRIVFGAGTPTEFALATLVDVREEQSFHGELFAGYPWLVLDFGGHEVGLMLRSEDRQAWGAALAPFARRR